jgi:hydroxymethylglutaryl-CoA synthase
MVFSGIIQPEYKEIVKRMNLEEETGPRTKLSMEEYKRLHGNERKFDDFLLNAHQEFVLTKIGGSTADKAGFREYSFVS